MMLCACVMVLSSLMTESVLMKDIFGDVRLYAHNKSWMTGWIFMTFVIDVMQFEANKESNLFISCVW
jgi:hypothetical protein